jgi:hypothetical protein
MAEKFSEKELVTFNKKLIAHSAKVDALAEVLIEKKIITEREFSIKLKKVQMKYTRKRAGMKV